MMVTLAALVLGIGWFCLPADSINQATCDKIKEGLIGAEVIELVGRKWDELTDSCWSSGTVGRWHGQGINGQGSLNRFGNLIELNTDAIQTVTCFPPLLAVRS